MNSQENQNVDICPRCGGAMDFGDDYVMDAGELQKPYQWKCLFCGNRIDPVILANRREQECRKRKRATGQKSFQPTF